MTTQPVALVTAASRGIGAACARELARRGYHLALLARSDEVERLADELAAIPVKGTVMREEDLRRLVEAALDRHGRIDLVVNNTGHAKKGQLLELSDEDWQHGVELLLLSVIRMTRLVTPTMLAQGSGAFVNISAFGAVEPSLQFPISSALRASLGAYTRLFARRYASAGIRMNTVLPGFIETWPADQATLAGIPANRLGTADEIARVVGFLGSPEASYLTGQSLLVDGGMVRGL